MLTMVIPYLRVVGLIVDGECDQIANLHIAANASGDGGQRVMRLFAVDYRVMVVSHQRINMDARHGAIVNR